MVLAAVHHVAPPKAMACCFEPATLPQQPQQPLGSQHESKASLGAVGWVYPHPRATLTGAEALRETEAGCPLPTLGAKAQARISFGRPPLGGLAWVSLHQGAQTHGAYAAGSPEGIETEALEHGDWAGRNSEVAPAAAAWSWFVLLRCCQTHPDCHSESAGQGLILHKQDSQELS